MPIVRIAKWLCRPITKDFDDIRKLNEVILKHQEYANLSPHQKTKFIVENSEYANKYLDHDQIMDIIIRTNSYNVLQRLREIIKGSNWNGKQEMLDRATKKMMNIEDKRLLREFLDSLREKGTSYDIIEMLKDVV
jgi:hypothetical protein